MWQCPGLDQLVWLQQDVTSPIPRASHLSGCHSMPSYLGTDISESKNRSKPNHNNLFPHLGQVRRFPEGQMYCQKLWIRCWRCQSCSESAQTCWELQFHWKTHSCVHRTLTSEKYWARRKRKTKRSPENSHNIMLASLFLESNFSTGGWT